MSMAAMSPMSPFHPATKYRSDILFDFSYLRSLYIVDIIAIYEDYQVYTTKRAKMQLLNKLVKAYHVSPKSGKSTGEAALHELMLRLLFELFNGFISLNDIKCRTWDRSMHRDVRHTMRIHRLLMLIQQSQKGLQMFRRIAWL